MKTPKEACLAYCRECVQGERRPELVESCQGDQAIGGLCPFYPYRLGQKRPSVKVIRKFCVQCMGGSEHLVRDCESVECLCWPYRMGTNPSRKGIGNEKAYFWNPFPWIEGGRVILKKG